MDTLIILSISCLLFVTVVSFLIIINKLLTKDSKNNEFVIYYNILISIIDLYKETILVNKINTLRTNFDLNEKSKTNSLSAFERAKNELISETVKEIMKVYLSKKCLNYLVDKYGVDGLGLLILTHLKR